MGRSLRSKRRLKNQKRKREALEPWKKSVVAKMHNELMKHISAQKGTTINNKPAGKPFFLFPLWNIKVLTFSSFFPYFFSKKKKGVSLSSIKNSPKYSVTVEMEGEAPMKLDKKISKSKKMNEIKVRKQILVSQNKSKIKKTNATKN